MTTDAVAHHNLGARPRSWRIFRWSIRWVWRGLVVLAVVGLLKIPTRRIEATHSFGGARCEVQLVRSYNDYGLFEKTHGYSIRFGIGALEPGQSVSQFDDLDSQYWIEVDPHLTIMKDISVTFSETRGNVRLPQIWYKSEAPQSIVVVKVPFTLCSNTRGGSPA